MDCCEPLVQWSLQGKKSPDRRFFNIYARSATNSATTMRETLKDQRILDMSNAVGRRYGAAFIGSLAPPPILCRELCKGAALVVAADSGLVTAENAEVRPDWIVGDMDSLPDLSLLYRYPPERVRRFPCDKDLLDTEIALNLLWDEGCGDITLIGGGGGRLDHLLALRALFDRPRCPRRWVTDIEDIHAVEEGAALELFLPVNTLVSVLPAANGPWKASSDGLKWPLDQVTIGIGWVGISNIADKKRVLFRSEHGRFLILHPLLHI
jgi:thiamine pyrophosphokinase